MTSAVQPNAASPAALRVVASVPTGLTHPKALVVDPDGRLFVGCASPAGGIACFVPDGRGGYLPGWKLTLGRVRGVGRMSDGTIVATVRQENTSRIDHFTANGQKIVTWGTSGDAPGQLCNPQSIAVTPDNRICLVETTAWDGSHSRETNRVQVFTATGVCEACWGGTGQQPGQLNLPIGIAVAGDGHLWVADSYNSRIQKFTRSGQLLSHWGRLGRGPGCMNVPQGLRPLPDGRVLVADTHNDRLQCFSEAGESLWMWGVGRGSAADQFWLPCAVTVDHLGRVLIADTMNQRIQICEVNL